MGAGEHFPEQFRQFSGENPAAGKSPGEFGQDLVRGLGGGKEPALHPLAGQFPGRGEAGDAAPRDEDRSLKRYRDGLVGLQQPQTGNAAGQQGRGLASQFGWGAFVNRGHVVP
jgi:hypothetical protein